jgi:hypothetical protein
MSPLAGIFAKYDFSRSPAAGSVMKSCEIRLPLRERRFEMASTEPVRVPERRTEIAVNTEISAAPRPLPSPRKTRFTIKMKGMVPT